VRLALIADTFPPLRNSGAIQLRDLAREFVRQGHSLTVLLPSADLQNAWVLENMDGLQVLRLKAPHTKDIGYVSRTLREFMMPYTMLNNLRKSPLKNESWDGVVWYSPSIFHGPLASYLKKRSGCKGYLIIRDIFPEWAVDMGLMGRGLPYQFFDAVARYQYSVADVIGVQTLGNVSYFDQWQKKSGHNLQVLQNWLDRPSQDRCQIRLSETPLADRKVFVYAGNMGVAQGMDILLDLAGKLRDRADIGFLFVGRGTDSIRLKISSKDRKLDNVLFYDEIHPDQIPDLYAQCSAGIVTLDPRHKSHNIPGKFLSYMQSGLPVLASVNPSNDLAQMIRSEQVGQVCESNQVGELLRLTDRLLKQIDSEVDVLPSRCRALFEREFTVERAVCQIVAAFQA
jgi:glycosyltransferase involved in cell wall biosynthesis